MQVELSTFKVELGEEDQCNTNTEKILEEIKLWGELYC